VKAEVVQKQTNFRELFKELKNEKISHPNVKTEEEKNCEGMINQIASEVKL